MSLSTQLVRLSDIKKSNSELRLHSPAQRKKARKLIERQGIVAPIILDGFISPSKPIRRIIIAITQLIEQGGSHPMGS